MEKKKILFCLLALAPTKFSLSLPLRQKSPQSFQSQQGWENPSKGDNYTNTHTTFLRVHLCHKWFETQLILSKGTFQSCQWLHYSCSSKTQSYHECPKLGVCCIKLDFGTHICNMGQSLLLIQAPLRVLKLNGSSPYRHS